MFLVANSERTGQYYFDEKVGTVYLCHFWLPKPGEETAPFSWLLAICFLVSIFLLPHFFVHPFSSILFNIGSFALVVCLGGVYTRRRRKRVKREGTAYVLTELSRDELKELEKGCHHGMAIYTGLSQVYLRVLILCLIGVAIIFSYGKQYIISIAFLLYAIELWGYDFYFTRIKHQKDYINTINTLLQQWDNGQRIARSKVP